MASLGEDIRSAIIGSTAVKAVLTDYAKPGVVEQSVYRENAPSPRIWFIRDNENQELDLSNDGGLVESQWTLECHSTSDATSISIADAIKRAFHGYIGSFGGRTAKSVKLEDHDDDYMPRGDASENGLAVAALRMTIWHAST